MRIRRRFPLLFALAVALALVGCSRQLITATPPTATSINRRTASIGEIVNIVLARASLAEQLAQVTPGYVLGAGGQVQTRDESRARLDFSDDTIVRLAENSSFTMQNVTPTDDGLVTRLKLEAGKIWVSLTGGTLEVETPVGVAAVRGSFAVIVYSAGDPADPNDDLLVLDCLEGSCSAQNDVVDEQLGNLQRTVLTRAGRITFLLSDLDVQNFIQNNPEVADVIRATLTAAPPPTTTPAPTTTDTPPGVTPESVPQMSATPTPLTPTPTARPGSTAAPGTTVQIIGLHTVLPGETIFCIGRAYGVLPTAIAQVNGTTSLTPGQILRIPAVRWENIPAGPVCPPQFTSPFPGLTPTNTPTPVASATTVPPTDRPDPTDTSSAPAAPTNTPSKTPLPVLTSTPSSTPSKIPTVPPTLTPSRTPTVPPTSTPTNTPTVTPSKTPTLTDTPTITPTPDLIGPSISNLRPSPTALNGSTCDVTFQADVGDASGVLSATVVWTSYDFSGIQFSTGNVTLTGPSTGGTWSGTVFGINVPAFGHVGWIVSATDTLNNVSNPISGPTINETAGYGC